MEVSKCWKMVQFPKISIKMKNCRRFYEGQTALRKLLSLCTTIPPNQIQSYYVSGAKLHQFLTEIYGNIQAFASKVLQVLGYQEMMKCKCFFWQNAFSDRKMLVEKFAKWEKFLAVLREHIIFDVKWVDVQKMSEIFRAKLYCKMSKTFSLVFVGFETFC